MPRAAEVLPWASGTGAAAPRILVEKARRTLSIWSNGRLAAGFAVVLGRNADADKRIEGDLATPLGDFYICAKNPRSKFFLSVCLSYPNLEHAARGLAAGLIGREEHAAILEALRTGRMPPQSTRLGGEIYIHGRAAAGGNDSRERNWTRGCIALDNAAMQEIYDRTVLGTQVRIVG